MTMTEALSILHWLKRWVMLKHYLFLIGFLTPAIYLHVIFALKSSFEKKIDSKLIFYIPSLFSQNKIIISFHQKLSVITGITL